MRDLTNFFDVFSSAFNYWLYDKYMAPQQNGHAEVWPKGWIPAQSPRLIRKTENAWSQVPLHRLLNQDKETKAPFPND